jgi:hypothetical protein
LLLFPSICKGNKEGEQGEGGDVVEVHVPGRRPSGERISTDALNQGSSFLPWTRLKSAPSHAGPSPYHPLRRHLCHRLFFSPENGGRETHGTTEAKLPEGAKRSGDYIEY